MRTLESDRCQDVLSLSLFSSKLVGSPRHLSRISSPQQRPLLKGQTGGYAGGSFAVGWRRAMVDGYELTVAWERSGKARERTEEGRKVDGEEASTEERDLGRKYPYQGKDNRSIERERVKHWWWRAMMVMMARWGQLRFCSRDVPDTLTLLKARKKNWYSAWCRSGACFLSALYFLHPSLALSK